MIRLMAVLILFSTSIASAGEYKLLSADRLDVEYTKLMPNNRDPYAPQYTGHWRDRAALKWDISVLGRAYWNNNTHTEMIDTGQVKTVGWEWEAGFHVWKHLDVYKYHHSRHIMDEEPQTSSGDIITNSFPVEDSYGIRIRFITK